jgi:hypothetical protein
MAADARARQTRRASSVANTSAGVAFCFLLVSPVVVPLSSQAAPIGSPLANEALTRCRQADGLEGDDRERVLQEGMRMAERAVATYETDAAAHFALFCSLGKHLQTASIGPSMLTDVRRVRHEIDRAIELAPHDPELWVAKAALLLALPGFLGGDRAEARRLLVRAVAADPDNNATRVYLDEALH